MGELLLLKVHWMCWVLLALDKYMWTYWASKPVWNAVSNKVMSEHIKLSPQRFTLKNGMRGIFDRWRSFVCYYATLWPAAPQLLVLHRLPEFVHIHAHWVGDAVQPSNPVTSSSCPQSFPPPGSFPMSQLFTFGSQSIGASASVLPVNIQGWFPLGLTGLILLSKELSRAFSSTAVWKNQFFGTQPSLCSNKTLLIKAGNRPDLTLGL